MRKSKKLKLSEKGKITLVAVAGTIAAIAIARGIKQLVDNNKEKYIIALTQDMEDDIYENKVPVQIDNKEIVEVADNTVVLVENKIKSGNKKNNVKVLKNGRLIEGEIEGKYLESFDIQLAKDDFKEYKDIYRNATNECISLRNDIKISNSEDNMHFLPVNALVLGSNKLIEEDNILWKPVIYISANGIYKGYADNNYLEKVENMKEYILNEDTSKIYEKENTSDNEMKIEDSPTDNTTADDKDSELIKKFIIGKVKADKRERITGLDVSYPSEELIRKATRVGINFDTLNTEYNGKVDISDLRGDIDFLYIRIGSTYNLNDEFYTDPEAYSYCEKHVKLCEELGIPYGFYYYSACINNDEAKKEYEVIKKGLNNLGKLKYNLLPFAVDVENNNGIDYDEDGEPFDIMDRQNGIDVTESKAYLTNLLKPLTGEVILYAGGKAVGDINVDSNGVEYKNSSKILDLQRYNELTGVTKIWMPTPRQEWFNSTMGPTLKEYMNQVPDCMKIIMQQEVLDGESNKNLSGGIDIDTIDKDEFINLIKEKEKVLIKDENDDVRVDFEYADR